MLSQLLSRGSEILEEYQHEVSGNSGVSKHWQLYHRQEDRSLQLNFDVANIRDTVCNLTCMSRSCLQGNSCNDTPYRCGRYYLKNCMPITFIWNICVL